MTLVLDITKYITRIKYAHMIPHILCLNSTISLLYIVCEHYYYYVLMLNIRKCIGLRLFINNKPVDELARAAPKL